MKKNLIEELRTEIRFNRQLAELEPQVDLIAEVIAAASVIVRVHRLPSSDVDDAAAWERLEKAVLNLNGHV